MNEMMQNICSKITIFNAHSGENMNYALQLLTRLSGL